MAIGGDGDVGRLLHQRQLVRRLDHPATAHDRVAGADLDARHRPAQAVHREETHRLLDPDRPGDAAIAQETGDALVRILMLVPDPHLGRDFQALADRRLLELGVTTQASPSRGMMSAVSRSLRHHCTPQK